MNKEFIYRDEEKKLSVEKNDSGDYSFKIDDKPFEISVKKFDGNNLIFVHDNKLYNTFVAADENGRIHVNYNGIPSLVLDKALEERGGDAGDDGAGGGNDIMSPIPGKVVKLNVKVGDRVSAGDTVIIVEAMKMETSYNAASDGEIEAVNAKEGDQIDANSLLVKINPDEE